MMIFKPSRRCATRNASAACFERKAMCHHRTNIHQPLRHQLDRAWIGMLHAPHEFDGQSFSARHRRGERCLILIWDSCQNYLSTDGTAANASSTASGAPAASNATSTPRPDVAARIISSSRHLLPPKRHVLPRKLLPLPRDAEVYPLQ